MIQAINVAGSAGNGALADIGAQVDLSGKATRISITVHNTHASAALTGFAILVKNLGSSDWVTRWTGADFDDMANFVDGDVVGTGSGGTGRAVYSLIADEYCELVLDIGPVRYIKFQAQSGSAGTTLTIMGMAHE